MSDDDPVMLTRGSLKRLRELLDWWDGQPGAKLSHRRAGATPRRPFASGTISGFVSGDAGGQTYEVDLSDPKGDFDEGAFTVEAWLNLEFYAGMSFDDAKRFSDGIRANLEWRYARWEIVTLPCPVAANLTAIEGG